MRGRGSVRKLVWSQTPDRTRGSASSSNTAATPPINRATGLLKTRQDTESAAARAGSPAGVVKSKAGTPSGWL